jgi:hypothetical protein
LTCIIPVATWSSIKKNEKEEEQGTRNKSKQTKCCLEGYTFAISVDTYPDFFSAVLMGLGYCLTPLMAAARFCLVCCRSTA